jgi:hypothetical protein
MYNLWENMYSKIVHYFGFLDLYSEHVQHTKLL